MKTFLAKPKISDAMPREPVEMGNVFVAIEKICVIIEKFSVAIGKKIIVLFDGHVAEHVELLAITKIVLKVILMHK